MRKGICICVSLQSVFLYQLQAFSGIYYGKQGKIYWAKHPWFHPCKVFHGNTFAVPWITVLIVYPLLSIYRKTFMALLKTAKTTKV